MQARFIAIPETAIYRTMTAIVRTFTARGFVIVADGRTTGDDRKTIITDSTQKIFEAASIGGSFALSTCGASEVDIPGGGSINLVSEFLKSAELLRRERIGDLRAYAVKLSEPVMEGLAQQGGSRFELEGSEVTGTDYEPGATVIRVFLDGYLNQRPASVTIRLFHESGKLQEPEIREPQLYPGHQTIYGSDVVARLLFVDEDPRFSRYRGRRIFAPEMTVMDAVERSIAYISACSDPVALELDEFCRTIGGHVHIATVKLDEGFQWLPGFSSISEALA